MARKQDPSGESDLEPSHIHTHTHTHTHQTKAAKTHHHHYHHHQQQQGIINITCCSNLCVHSSILTLNSSSCRWLACTAPSEVLWLITIHRLVRLSASACLVMQSNAKRFCIIVLFVVSACSCVYVCVCVRVDGLVMRGFMCVRAGVHVVCNRDTSSQTSTEHNHRKSMFLEGIQGQRGMHAFPTGAHMCLRTARLYMCVVSVPQPAAR